MIIILEQLLVQGRLLTIIPRLSTEWIVSFTIRMKTLSMSELWCSLTHLTQNGNNENHGDRTPAVFLEGTPTIIYALFTASVDGDKSHQYISSQIPKINEMTHFEIHQRYVSGGKYRYFIKMNGQEIYATINDDARQFYNVKVYASHPLIMTYPAYIKNFSVTNFL